ncbi:hypothetical protein Esti_005191 [Eimeria stiedai]
MPLTSPVGPLNLFVDFFGRPPEGSPSRTYPAWLRCCPAGGPLEEVTVPTEPSSPGEPPCPPPPTDKGGFSHLFGCKDCLPGLFVLTHAHTDHLRGLGPSWAKGLPRGPLLCTETSRRLLLQTHPYLGPLVLPLALHTPYLFFVRRSGAGGPLLKNSRRGPPQEGQQHRSCCSQLSLNKQQLSLSQGACLEPPEIEDLEPKKALLGASPRTHCNSSCCCSSDSSNSSSSGEEQQAADSCGTASRLLVDHAAAAARSSSTRRGFCCSCGSAVVGVYVHLIDARHCAGSALLLLRSPSFGSFVYTGDFCCSDNNLLPLLQQVQLGLQLLQQLDDPAAAAAAAAAAGSSVRSIPDASVSMPLQMKQQQQQQQQHKRQQVQQQLMLLQQQMQQQMQQVDVLFLDNTYLHPSFAFLSQRQAIQVMCEHVRRACSEGAPSQGAPNRVLFRGLPRDSLHLHVIVGVERVGKETLLQQLGEALGTRVRLSEAHYDFVAAAAAPAAQSAAAGAADSCMYTLELFIRGFGCPFVQAATQTHSEHSSSNKYNGSSSWCGCCSSNRCCNSSDLKGRQHTGVNGRHEGLASLCTRHEQQQQQQQDQQQQQQNQQQQQVLQQDQQQQRRGHNVIKESYSCCCSLFAVPRRSLQKVVGALEAQGLNALGLLPSGGCVDSLLSGSVHAVPFSSHSSFSSLQLFVEALGPKKVVLLESLPVPCSACTTAPKASSFEAEEGVSPLPTEGGAPACAQEGDVVGGASSWRAPSGDEAPAAFLLDNAEAVDVFDDVKAEGLRCTDTSSRSSNAALEAARRSDCKPAREDWGREALGVSAAFNYDGREGLAALLEATGAPVVILGCGRRVYCTGGPPHACVLKGLQQKRKRRAPPFPRHVFSAPKLKLGPPETPAKTEEAGEAEARLLLLPPRRSRALRASWPPTSCGDTYGRVRESASLAAPVGSDSAAAPASKRSWSRTPLSSCTRAAPAGQPVQGEGPTVAALPLSKLYALRVPFVLYSISNSRDAPSKFQASFSAQAASPDTPEVEGEGAPLPGKSVEAGGSPTRVRVQFDLSGIPGTENARGGLMALLFTCCKCNTRSAKKFSKVAYYKGVVIVRCPCCKSLHLVADRLNWFGDETSDIETILAAKGEAVLRSLTEAHCLDVEGMNTAAVNQAPPAS